MTKKELKDKLELNSSLKETQMILEKAFPWDATIYQTLSAVQTYIKVFQEKGDEVYLSYFIEKLTTILNMLNNIDFMIKEVLNGNKVINEKE